MGSKPSVTDTHWRGIAHLRIPLEVLDSPAWRVLGFSDKALFVDLRAKLRSTNNGNINAAESEMVHRGWTAPATLHKCLRVLEWMGFIEKVRQGGIGGMSKTCNLYRFTDVPSFDHPKQGVSAQKPTSDYLKYDSVKLARAAMRELREKIEAEKQQRKKSKLQKLKLVASKNEVMRRSKASKFEG